MLLEDRVITTDRLRHQACLGLQRTQLWLPDRLLDALTDPAFHVLVPAGRASGPETDKLLVQLVLDADEGTLRYDVMVDDAWFASLPTATQLLGTVSRLLPSFASSSIDDLGDDEDDL